MKIKLSLSIALIAASCVILFESPQAHATQSNQISDGIFYNSGAMSESAIESFIGSFPNSCLLAKNYPNGLSPITFSENTGYSNYGANVSPARIIWNTSQLYKINPQVILTTLEKEQNLVTGAAGCAVWKYNSAMGYNCPDGSENALKDYPNIQIYRTCVARESNAGFSRQVNHAGWQLSFDGKRANGDLSWNGDGATMYYGRMTQGNRARVNGGQVAYYDGYTTIDGQSIYLENGATAALYNYTPHFSNFETIFTKWFGSTQLNIKSNIFLPNDTFVLKSMRSNRVADVANGYTNNGAIVQIYDRNDSAAQQWKPTRQSNGFYKLQNINSGRYLTVSTSGSGIEISDNIGSCSQEWAINFQDNRYKFLSACSGLALDVGGDQISNRSGLTVSQSNLSSSQAWQLVNLSTPDVASDVYRIKAPSDKVIDIDGESSSDGARLQLYSAKDTAFQRFHVVRSEDGFYSIRSVNTGKYFDVAGGSEQRSAKIQIYTGNNTCAQKWIIKPSADRMRILSACSGLALDIKDEQINQDKASLQLWDDKMSISQKWQFVTANTVASGTYTIKSLLDTSKVVDIDNNLGFNGNRVQIWQDKSIDGQRFVFTKLSDGTYTLKSVGTGKMVDVRAASTSPGAMVQIYDQNDSCAQKWWILSPQSSSKILSSCSGLALDVDNANSNNGTSVKLWTNNGNKAQQWLLAPSTP